MALNLKSLKLNNNMSSSFIPSFKPSSRSAAVPMRRTVKTRLLVYACEEHIYLPKLQAKHFPACESKALQYMAACESKALQYMAILVQIYAPIIRAHLIVTAAYVLVTFVLSKMKEATGAAPDEKPAKPNKHPPPAPADQTLPPPKSAAQKMYRDKINTDILALMIATPLLTTDKHSILQSALTYIKNLSCVLSSLLFHICCIESIS